MATLVTGIKMQMENWASLRNVVHWFGRRRHNQYAYAIGVSKITKRTVWTGPSAGMQTKETPKMLASVTLESTTP